MTRQNTKSLHRSICSTVSAMRGFTLLEFMVSATILTVVIGAAVSYISLTVKRSKAEQSKVDLTQQARSFVDEFERDFHQAGYPGCANFNGYGTNNCATTAHFNSATFAAGIVSISNTNLIFEGDVDGDGIVDSVQYRLVDSNNNYPPTTTCPCTLQRSQMAKVANASGPPYGQPTNFSQELQFVVNSGVPGGNSVYGGGLPIAGNTLFGNGQTNTSYYAAISTFKDFPVITAYDDGGLIVPLPLDNSTPLGQQTLWTIRSVRITINLLASGNTGYDQQSLVRPVVTLVGDARRNNRMPWEP